MALVVETGAGLSNAESYLSIEDADTYIDKYVDSDDWNGASEVERERALRLASQYIDAEYGSRWNGTRANRLQALDWPRMDVVDRDGFGIDSDAIPQKLKDATAEAAVRSLSGTLMADRSGAGEIKRERVRVEGAVEEEIEYSSGKKDIPIYDLIDNLLRGLITVSLKIERA